MTENSSERALLAILALESEAGSSLDEPMPALDARVEMYVRAMRGEDAEGDDPAKARELILEAIAEDIAEESEPNDAAQGSQISDIQTNRLPLARRLGQGRLRAAPLRFNRTLQRIGAFAASAAALVMVAWSGAWFYALNSFNTTIAEWRAWEEKSGRQYSCATEGFGGFPFKVEMTCGSPKASITTENGKFAAEAKALRVAVDLFHPKVIASKLEGPVTFAEVGKPDSFESRWSHAEATVRGPKPTPDGVSIALADFRVDRISGGGTEPLASAEKITFRAELDSIESAATKKAAYDLTSDITAGSLPSGPPLAARPFEARFKAVLHGAGDMTPKPLPARTKDWQRNGGTVEVTSVELRGNFTDAKAQGTIALSANGGLEGVLELSGAQYDRLLAALTGTNLEVTTRRLTGDETNMESSRTKARKLPALRFEDGAAYFGSISLGHLPALF